VEAERAPAVGGDVMNKATVVDHGDRLAIVQQPQQSGCVIHLMGVVVVSVPLWR
jgi:hypothetical protein